MPETIRRAYTRPTLCIPPSDLEEDANMTPAQQTTKPAPAHPNPTRAAAASAAAADKKPAKVAKVDETLTKKVKVITEGGKNPKKEGSKAHARFALYKTGQTVEAYLVAAVAAGESRRNARNDITYDVAHKFIELN